MDSPVETLKMRAFEIFTSTELNEPLLMIYQQLGIALRDHSDFVKIDRNAFIQVADGKTIPSMQMTYGDTSIFDVFRANLDKILQRDNLIKQHFQIEHTDEDNIVLKTIRD